MADLLFSILVAVFVLNFSLGLPILVSTAMYGRKITPLAVWLPIQAEVLITTERCTNQCRVLATILATIVFLPLELLWLIISPIFNIICKNKKNNAKIS